MMERRERKKYETRNKYRTHNRLPFRMSDWRESGYERSKAEKRKPFERKRMDEGKMEKKPWRMSQKNIAFTEVYEAF
jgi:hypothetical protein